LRGQRRFEAASLNRLAQVLRRQGNFDSATARHEQALSIYRELGDEHGELSVMTGLTAAYRETGDLTRARLNALDVEARAAALDDDLLEADAAMQSAYVAEAFDKHDKSIEHFTAARTIFENLGDAPGIRVADEGIALASLALGDTARTLAIAQTALDTARASESAVGEARTNWLLGRIAQSVGDSTAGNKHFDAAIRYARDHDNESLLIDSAISLSQLHIDNGDYESAAVLLDEIRDRAARRYDYMRVDARRALAAGDADAAIEILSRLRAVAGEAWRPDDEAFLGNIARRTPDET
jgi:tetratricopeptide (TPR) repeat protein